MSTKKEADKYFDLYTQHALAVSLHFRRSQLVASLFGKAIRDHLGLPETFETFDGRRSEQWTRFYQWNNETSTVGATLAPSALDAADATGTVHFAVGLALSQSEDSFPKTYFYMHCALLPTPTNMSLTLGDKGESGRFELDDQGGNLDFTDAVSAFLGAIETTLATPLYQNARDTRSFGFIPN